MTFFGQDRIPTEPLADLKAIHTGHHHVQQHQIGREFVRLRQRFRAAADQIQVVAFRGQDRSQRITHGGLIVYNQNVLSYIH